MKRKQKRAPRKRRAAPKGLDQKPRSPTAVMRNPAPHTYSLALATCSPLK